MTQVPLPRWADVCRVLLMPPPSTDSLSRVWTGDSDTARWFSRSAWSLFAIARWRVRATGRATLNVWVPDYFCDESLGLLRASGANLVFYPVDPTAHSDESRFPAVTPGNKPDLFLLVHYFGQPSPAVQASAFCRRHGAWLVEDAAHVLQPIPGVGDAGDCVLYSPHKHLAIPDGAVLVIRAGGPSALANRGDLAVLDQVRAEILRDGSTLQSARWLAKRLLQKLGVRSWRAPGAFADDAVAAQAPEAPAMSGLSARLLALELGRLSSIASHRAMLAAAWNRTLRALSFGRLNILPAPHTPYLACVTGPDRRTVEGLYSSLLSIGVPAATWPDLPKEVVTARDSHAPAIGLRYSRLYLPVHQSMNARQIAAAARTLGASMPDRWSLNPIASRAEWERLWLPSARKSLPQTWEYGSAKVSAEGWRVERYAVVDQEGVPAALFQVLVKGLPWIGGVARVNRGPVILRDEPDGDYSLALGAIAALLGEARRRRWWMIQIAPLLPPGEELEQVLRQLGLRKRPDYPADSALMSLEGTEEELLMRLDRKWRNCLRKGQKLGVIVDHRTGDPRALDEMIALHAVHQCERGFAGTPERVLRALASERSSSYSFDIFIAREQESPGGAPIGVLATIRFGDAAEYLLAAVNDSGRAQQANSVMLWEAILYARRSGCRWFDVGGLAVNTPKPIADFKKGLNAAPYTLVGEWRRWL